MQPVGAAARFWPPPTAREPEARRPNRIGVANLIIDDVERDEQRVIEKSADMRRSPAVEPGGAVKQSHGLIERLYDLIAILGSGRGPLLRSCPLVAYPVLLGSEHLAIDMADNADCNDAPLCNP